VHPAKRAQGVAHTSFELLAQARQPGTVLLEYLALVNIAWNARYAVLRIAG
jgi:hypothetical protein